MASIRKKNGKWQVQIRRKGFPPKSRSFLKKSDASEWARAMESMADRRELPPEVKVLGTTTLGDLVRRYRDEVAAKKKCAPVEIIVLNAFLRHKICRKSLASITISDWTRYRDERLQSITGKSLKRELSPIRHMFGMATKDWGYPLIENAFEKITVKSEDRRRERRLSPSEQQKLADEAKRTRGGYLEDAVAVALETGMRRGELLNIRSAHVDFRRRVLSIPETKNGESRTIPLTKTALNILHRRSTQTDGEGRLFATSANSLRLSWERTCRRAKIIDLHFHDLRHEAISRFFEMGLTTPEVALISGHKDVRMLFRYAHGTQQAILKKFETSQERG